MNISAMLNHATVVTRCCETLLHIFVFYLLLLRIFTLAKFIGRFERAKKGNAIPQNVILVPPDVS